MTSSAIAELDRPSRVACSDLLAVFLCPIKKHLNHFFELEGADPPHVPSPPVCALDRPARPPPSTADPPHVPSHPVCPTPAASGRCPAGPSPRATGRRPASPPPRSAERSAAHSPCPSPHWPRVTVPAPASPADRHCRQPRHATTQTGSLKPDPTLTLPLVLAGPVALVALVARIAPAVLAVLA